MRFECELKRFKECYDAEGYSPNTWKKDVLRCRKTRGSFCNAPFAESQTAMDGIDFHPLLVALG